MSETSQQMDVSLEMFEGPLDLLLHLIKKNDLEISDIPIAQITHEYLAYLDVLKDLNLEMAGEFLVMASTLMQIKAHMLLPAPDASEEDSGPDPRAELVNKLLEYQRFKEAAGVLTVYKEKAKDIYYRDVPPHFDHEDFMLRATVLDLLSAFKRVLDQAPREVGHILREEITIEGKIRDVLDRLEKQPSMAFSELFSGAERRIDLIITFLALLELIRMKQVVAMQSDTFGSIRLFRADAAPLPEPEPIVEPIPEPSSLAVAEQGPRDPPPATAGNDAIIEEEKI
jgi:segregation and condensation protein A